MSIVDSLLVSVFGMSVVFIVLIALSFLVQFQSTVLGAVSKKQKPVADNTEVSSDTALPQNNVSLSSGELKLIGVDEKTAAMIMAIVSDESQIPLSELQFKSIKAL